MKVGVIGTGSMGRNHVRIYSDLREVECLYLTDTNAAAGREMVQRHNAEFVSDLESLLKKVEAVSICVPTRSHFEVAKRAMEAGVHCLIEKPVALTLAEGTELARIAEKAGVITGVGHIERFNPMITELCKIVSEPYCIEINRHNPSSGRITDTDVITDLMVHDIDLVWNVLMRGRKGELLSAAGLKRGQIDFALAVARFGGCLSVLSSNRVSSKKVREIIVEQEDRTMVGDLTSQELFIYYKPSELMVERLRYKQENRMEQVTVGKIEPLREELRAFMQCVREKKPFPVTIGEATAVMEVAEKIRQMV